MNNINAAQAQLEKTSKRQEGHFAELDKETYITLRVDIKKLGSDIQALSDKIQSENQRGMEILKTLTNISNLTASYQKEAEGYLEVAKTEYNNVKTLIAANSDYPEVVKPLKTILDNIERELNTGTYAVKEAKDLNKWANAAMRAG
jgi:septation ring formation regulator EzrA